MYLSRTSGDLFASASLSAGITDVIMHACSNLFCDTVLGEMWINVYSVHRGALTDQSTDTTKTQLGESASVQGYYSAEGEW